MTLEEAVELLCYGDWLNVIFKHIGKTDTGRIAEAMSIVGKAIRPVSRERVEKVWRGEWVKRHKHRGGFRRVKGIDDMGEQHEVTIDERCKYDDLYCSKCGKQSPDNFLNFCGYCGAPMTDEAVEIVMERMGVVITGRTIRCICVLTARITHRLMGRKIVS